MILTIYSFVQIAFILTLLGLFRTWFRLRFVPGPFLAGFTDLWRTYHMFRGDYAETLLKLHERYGSLVRTGPNNISIGDPLEIEPVYRTNPVHDMVCLKFADKDNCSDVNRARYTRQLLVT
jgi:hypothetical protein